MDFSLRCGSHTSDYIIKLQHLDVAPELPLHRREVGVQIQHARVGMAQEAKACRSYIPRRFSCPAPRLDLLPGHVVFEERSRDDLERDACAGQCSADLRDAAGRAVGEPLFGRHRLIR